MNILEQIEAKGLWEREIELKRNQFLHQAGDRCPYLYLVTEGCFRIFILDESEEQTVRFAYGQDMFAVLDSFISDEPTAFYVQAIRKARVKAIPKKAYFELVESSAENKAQWIGILVTLVSQQMEREIDVLTSSPRSRYERVLKRSPQLFQEVPHKYIASYLRMTPETLSRLKKS